MRIVEEARIVIVPILRIGTNVKGFATVTYSGSPTVGCSRASAMQTVTAVPGVELG